MKKLYAFLKPGIFPLTIALTFLIFFLLYKLLRLPSPSELVLLIENWFNKYGLYLLFISAFLEGVFIIGMYFPGSLAIALAVYTLGKTPLDLFYIGSIAFMAFIAANIFNYYIGKLGYYKLLMFLGEKKMIERLKISMNKHAFKTFFLTGFFPNIIAITSVSAGIGRLRFSRTLLYLIASLFFWVTIWTIVGSLIVKKINFDDKNQFLYLLLVVLFWAVFLIVRENYFSKRRREEK